MSRIIPLKTGWLRMLAIFSVILLSGLINPAMASADKIVEVNPPDVIKAVHPSARDLVERAIEQWRASASWSKVVMRIHRPDWEREMALESWTRGEKDALIRFTAPTKDAGNATLKLDDAMWMYTPKLNQVIKLPASMMAQSWMGSDFSYNDLAKSDRLLTDYELKLIAREEQDGHQIYQIEATPKPDAPVVWGKEILRIREDFILMEEQFFDQNGELVKRMRTLKIAPLSGRLYPVVMRMERLDEAERWTEIETRQARFDIKLPDFLFTQSNLRNPRNWSAE